MAHQDKITLAGQEFYVKGPVVGKPISEFTTGLKVGRATYDERLHAFWLVLDDFSGGMNHRRLDIREALGTVFDNNGGVDIRRAGHLTLPPLQAIAAVTAPSITDYSARQPSVEMIGTDVGGALLSIAGCGGALFWSDSAGNTWTKIKDLTDGGNAYMIARILESGLSGTATLYAFPEGGNGTAQYVKCTGDPKTSGNWTVGGAGATKVWEDAILWSAFGKDLLIATTPIAKIGYSEDGENWNVDSADADVSPPIWQANYGRVQFVGTFMAPWGQSAVYFLARDDAGINSLFVLDFYAHQAHKIEIGNQMHLHDALVWNGSIIVTDGWSVWQYDPGQVETIRDISFPRKGGLCPTLVGGSVARLIGGNAYLFALLYSPGNVFCQVLAYNGVGWTTLGPRVADFAPTAMAILSDWQPATVNTTRRLCMMGTNTPTTQTTFRTMTLTLPAQGEVPVRGTDSFQDGPLHFTTGWIDGGFHEINGTLFWMKIDAFNLSASENVKVEYRLDNDESAGWTQMRDSSNSADVFNALTDVLYFSATTPKKGIEFRTVQFRFTFDRGSTATNTPEVVSFTLLYDKKPALREAWAAELDVNLMITENGNDIKIDGNNPTMANIWVKLRAIWNTHPLVELDVPNVRTGILVRLTDMPITVDDFRDAVDGKGSVTLQMLEPTD